VPNVPKVVYFFQWSLKGRWAFFTLPKTTLTGRHTYRTIFTTSLRYGFRLFETADKAQRAVDPVEIPKDDGHLYMQHRERLKPVQCLTKLSFLLGFGE